MIQNKKLLFLVGIVCFFVGCSNNGKSDKNIGIWVPYAVSNTDSIIYYDRTRITKMRPHIIKVWTKREFSKEAKDRHIKYRKDHNLSIDGWDQLDYEIIFKELDCENVTSERIMTEDYNDKGAILMSSEDLHPQITEILPGSSDEVLLGIVCK